LREEKGTIMFAEYIRIISFDGDTGLTSNNIWRAAVIILSGIFLIFIGYKIKGMWGALIALLAAIVAYLYVNGILRI
jgi:hypothetical protein